MLKNVKRGGIKKRKKRFYIYALRRIEGKFE